MKKIVLLVVVLLMVATAGFVHAENSPMSIGLLLSIGGLGDKSFNDATYSGIQKMRKIPGVSVDVVEPANVAAMEDGLEYLSSRKLDLIFAVGLFANEAVRQASARHPELKYVLIDSVVTAPNVLSILFNEEEGSFYAGALAGLLSKNKKVGFLGGMTSPVIASFERGFKNGLSFVSPESVLTSTYAGETPEAFANPEAGKRIAFEMAAKGVDVIYHAAGATGLGLIEAARRSGFLVIGVDSDQSALVPGKVAASMVKRIDVALERAVKLVRENHFQGGVLTLGLADSGVELVISRFNKNLITPVICERLKEVEQFILHPSNPAKAIAVIQTK